MTDGAETARWVERLRRLVKGCVAPDACLAELSSFRIGGRCDVLIEPGCPDDVIAVRRAAREAQVQLFLLGNASNVLIDDQGLRGWVIRIGPGLAAANWQGAQLCVQAGAQLPALARTAARRGLSGLEFAVGIPGTVGGAVAMNAGAAGAQMADIVREVSVLSPEGQSLRLPGEQLDLGYRTSRLRESGGWIVLEAVMDLAPGDSRQIERAMADQMARRRRTQPVGLPSVGSIFRNPQGDHAARLIEAAGCKGWCEGDAMVSDKHPGWIVNLGQATAEQVLSLIRRVREAVFASSGVELSLEVVLLGPRLAKLL